MLSRALASRVLGRLSPASARGVTLRSARAVSMTTGLAKEDAPVPAAPRPVLAGQRAGLTGFLQDKTGVTGAGILGVGVTAYLFSKEIYILTSETVIGVVLFGVIYVLMKKIGQPVKQYLDDRSAKILAQFNEGRAASLKHLQESIADEANVETMLETRTEVFDILRENNAMGLEEEYRHRLLSVTSAVRRKLDYQVAVDRLAHSFEHQHLVSWLEKTVTDSITSKQEENLTQCMADMKRLQVAV